MMGEADSKREMILKMMDFCVKRDGYYR